MPPVCLSWCMHSRTRSEDRCFEGWTHFAGSPSPGGYFHHKTVNVIRIDYKGLGKYGQSRQLAANSQGGLASWTQHVRFGLRSRMDYLRSYQQQAAKDRFMIRRNKKPQCMGQRARKKFKHISIAELPRWYGYQRLTPQLKARPLEFTRSMGQRATSQAAHRLARV